MSGYAEAYGAGVAEDVRRLLFRTYWIEDADIGDPRVLRTPLAGPILRGTQPLIRYANRVMPSARSAGRSPPTPTEGSGPGAAGAARLS